MNPETNTMEPLSPASQEALHALKTKSENMAAFADATTLKPGQLLRPNGEPVPEHWSTYKVDEEVAIKNYLWRVAHIGERHLLLEPVGPVLINKDPG